MALVDQRDEHHRWAVAQFKAHPPPFFTCEAVLTEASHILKRNGFLDLIGRKEDNFVARVEGTHDLGGVGGAVPDLDGSKRSLSPLNSEYVPCPILLKQRAGQHGQDVFARPGVDVGFDPVP